MTVITNAPPRKALLTFFQDRIHNFFSTIIRLKQEVEKDSGVTIALYPTIKPSLAPLSSRMHARALLQKLARKIQLS